jgi:predicted metalloendopeptidase
MTDVHSPGKFRVNGPVVNIDAFYEAFSIDKQSPMYLPNTERVSVW